MAGKLCFLTQNLDGIQPHVTLACEGEGRVRDGMEEDFLFCIFSRPMLVFSYRTQSGCT